MTTLTAPTAAELAKQALGRLNSLATLPEVTAKVIKLVEDPKSSAQQLHAVVKHDPALVTRVLKVVNSAFYGLPGQVTNIDRAIVLLGLNAVKNLSVAASMGQMFRGLQMSSKHTAKDLWSHCVSVAVVAREIAKKSKPALAEEAFLGGMIHDIGLLISLQTWPEQVREACDGPQDKPFIEIEKQTIGVAHPYLGKALAEKWQFPKCCQSVAAFHHMPHLAAESERAVVAIVYVADTLCCQQGDCFCLTAASQSVTDEHLKLIGTDAATIDGVRHRLPEIIRSASALVS